MSSTTHWEPTDLSLSSSPVRIPLPWAHCLGRWDSLLWHAIAPRQSSVSSKANQFPAQHGAERAGRDLPLRSQPVHQRHGLSREGRRQSSASGLVAGRERRAGRIGPIDLNIPAIEGIGGSHHYFVDRYGAQEIYDVDFVPIPGAAQRERIDGAGLTYIDHLTHNVQRGNMKKWADFYERIFNFREIRYFDIEGKKTGLFSRAMTSPCGKIRIPINESQDDKSQIEEYLREYHGEGIQHIALASTDIYRTVDVLRRQGVAFQDSPDTYYEGVQERVPGHGEKLEELARRRILIDGNPRKGEGVLLQIFTQNVIGPIFFEIIQRKGNEGFGEGNFRALFESIELDQIRRGVV
jgi:4-hydroxyphenylpyruvate dioxygenase